MKVVFVDNVLLQRTPNGYAIELQPHLGLISLIATLRAANYAAELYDPKIELAKGALQLDASLYDAAALAILERSPDVVGFTSLGSNFVCTLKVARAVRHYNPHIPILLGGPHASIVDREILAECREFDVIARGEAEPTIVPLLAALGGSLPFTAVEGLTFRNAGRIERTRDVSPVLDLDALPIAAYDAYPIDDLQLTSLDIDAGRGCPFGCSFCSTATFFGRRYRIKSPQRLVAELDMLAARYGIRAFNLTHDLFTVNKSAVRAFCAAVIDRHYTWNCSARLDCVDELLLSEMRKAGCEAIYFGVETGSRRLQRLVEKRLDLDLYHPVIQKTVALGIQPTVSFITGFPSETREDRDATLGLMRETFESYGAAVNVQLHLLTPEPGTALFAQYAQSLRFDGHTSDFTFPLLESADQDLLQSNSSIFACHHFFSVNGQRAEDISITEAYRLFHRLGAVFLAAVLRRYRGTFRKLLNELAIFRHHCNDDEAALVALIKATFGSTDPFYDVVNYITACLKLHKAGSESPIKQLGDQVYQLSHRAFPMASAINGARLLEHLAAGKKVMDFQADRAPRLLLAPPQYRDGRPAIIDIDETTFYIASKLREPTTQRQLIEEFGDSEVEKTLRILLMLGLIVEAENIAGQSFEPPQLFFTNVLHSRSG